VAEIVLGVYWEHVRKNVLVYARTPKTLLNHPWLLKPLR